MKARRMIAGTHEVPAGFLDREVAKRRRKPSKADYLSASKMPAAWVEGVVTNPPYRYAQRFAERAFYVALLLRTNFLMDAEDRGCWLDRNEPTRADYLLLRLPMMHREGWTGKRSSSNTPSPGSSGRRPRRANFRSVYWEDLPCIKKPVTSASGRRFRARRESWDVPNDHGGRLGAANDGEFIGARRLQAVASNLGREWFAVLQMTVIDDLPWARIGTALGLTSKTAKTCAIIALQMLVGWFREESAHRDDSGLGSHRRRRD